VGIDWRLRAVTRLTLAAIVTVVFPMSAGAQAAPSLERCWRLIAEFDRYFSRIRETGTSGPMLDRQIAEVKCRAGDIAEGTRLIEGALQRNRMPLPSD